MNYEELHNQWNKDCFKDIHSNFLKVEELSLTNKSGKMVKRIAFYIKDDLFIFATLTVNPKENKATTDIILFFENTWIDYYDASIAQFYLKEMEIVTNEIQKVNDSFNDLEIQDDSEDILIFLKEIPFETKEKDTSIFKKNHPDFQLS